MQSRRWFIRASNNWEPLLYAAYSRLNSEAEGHSTLEVARLLLEHGADPNAAFLWEGHYLFTALTGAFGEGEAGPVNQPNISTAFNSRDCLWNRGRPQRQPDTVHRMFTHCILRPRVVIWTWSSY